MSNSESVFNEAPQITTTTVGVTLGTTAVQVYANPVPITDAPTMMHFLRAWNVAASGGGTIWLTRNPAIGLNVAANLAGCFPLAPGQYEVFQIPQSIPLNPLFATATAEGTPLTIEAG